jgi:serine/threonine protein phosphatase PrpC
MTLHLRFAAHSEVGLVRKNNQDSGYASANLLVVADGMGGAAAGDLASAVAIDAIRKVDAPTPAGQMLEVLAGALHKANDRIADLVDADYALEGMGTTVTGVLFDGSQFGLAHIGDSRAYLLHENRLERLTHDHSWVQSLVDEGKINQDEAAVHPHRSLLLKVLNGQPANDPDLTLVRVEPGDRLLLCSDGLCGLVDDPAIEESLRLPNLDAALGRLVEEALAAGGIDNITVILADVVETEDTPRVFVLGAAAERDIPAVQTRIRAASSSPASIAADDEEEEGNEEAVPSSPTIAGGPRHHGGEDESRYNPQPPRKHRRSRVLIAVVALLLVAAAGLGSAYAWTRTQFYVGAADDRVAIFQGISEGFPGISLSRLYEIQPLSVSALPPYYQQKVRATMAVANLSAARQTISELSEAARRCAIQKPTGKPPPAPSSSAPLSTKPTSATSVTPSPVRPTKPTASPSPSRTAVPGQNC